jgi:hypothetical protein
MEEERALREVFLPFTHCYTSTSLTNLFLGLVCTKQFPYAVILFMFLTLTDAGLLRYYSIWECRTNGYAGHRHDLTAASRKREMMVTGTNLCYINIKIKLNIPFI